jgi:hypothetical protein
MRKPNWMIEEEARATETVHISVPVLCEAIAVTLFIAACAVCIIVAATPGVPV